VYPESFTPCASGDGLIPSSYHSELRVLPFSHGDRLRDRSSENGVSDIEGLPWVVEMDVVVNGEIGTTDLQRCILKKLDDHIAYSWLQAFGGLHSKVCNVLPLHI